MKSINCQHRKRIENVLKYLFIILLIGFLYAIWCHISHWHIPCIFHQLTGLYCPGCGTTRMCLALVKGNFMTAFRCNQAIFLIMPLGLLLALKIIFNYIKLGVIRLSKCQIYILWGIVVWLVLFGVLRNIPVFSGLRPC